MHEQNYPYQQLSLDDLNGELWKDIPGHEGYYMISNFGRIKRLERGGVDKRKVTYIIKPLILKPTVHRSLNTTTGDYRCLLRIGILRDSKIYTYSPARLVYYSFVEQFELANKELFVLYKDGDGLNLRPENLMLGTQKDKAALMDAAGRRGQAQRMTAKKREQYQKKIVRSTKQKGVNEVSRYSLTGQLLETYPGTKAAATAMGLSASHISSALRGNIRMLTAGGYLWRYGKDPYVDVRPILEKRWQYPSPFATLQKNIGQYNLEGELINAYSSVKEAAKAVNVRPQNIHRAISGKAFTSAGFIWKESTKAKISVKSLRNQVGVSQMAYLPEDKQVSQYDFDGKWIKTYATAAEASRVTGIAEGDIYSVVNNYRKITAGGFLWRRGSALRLNVNTLRKHPHYDRSALARHMKKKKMMNLVAEES